jgi:hypothetical protein
LYFKPTEGKTTLALAPKKAFLVFLTDPTVPQVREVRRVDFSF